MTTETITSRQNALVKHLRALAVSRSEREKSGEYLCDGTKLLDEALRWGADVRTAVFRKGTAIPALPDGARVACVDEALMRAISPTETPQGVLFTVALPDRTLPERLPEGRWLVLDGVQDPGNVGTILRTADAFECSGVLLVNACADVYSPKTVRATMGAVFRIPTWTCQVKELAQLLNTSKLPLIGTALRADTRDVRGAVPPCAAIAVGSEGRGLSQEVLALCAQTVRIPMSPRCESLNAAMAAGIVLWETYR